VKEDEMGRTCSIHEEMGNAYRILAGKLKGKRLGRPRHTLKENIKIDL
jgi:hypothetical protein